MRLFFFFITFSLILIPFHSDLYAADEKKPKWCKAKGQTKVNIIPRADEVVFDSSLNLEQLSQKNIDTDSPYDDSVVTHTQGLMEGKINLMSKSKIGAVGRNDICLYFDEITVEINISPKIYIANNYKRKGCMYKEILKHEMMHVKVDREVVNKYSNKVGHKILEVIDEMPVVGPVRRESYDEVSEKMRKYLKSKIVYINAQLIDERKRRQNMVDSLEEYQRMEDQNICTDERNKVNAALRQRR